MIIAYDTEDNKETLIKYDIDKWITKTNIQDADAEKELFNTAKKGDTIVTSSLINLSLRDNEMLNKIKEIDNAKIHLIALNECFDSSSLEGRALLKAIPVLLKFSTKRESILREAKIKGIPKAKEEGRYNHHGRKETEIKNEQEFKLDIEKLSQFLLTKTEMAKKWHVSAPTLNKLIKRYQ